MAFPAPKPAHYALIPGNVTEYALWHNVDLFDASGVDEVRDIFCYPWAGWDDNQFGGAMLGHIVEHIPHMARGGATMDGFFAFFAELWRVLEPGACVHILSPHGMSTNAHIDPTHTRALFPETFSYLVPDDNAPFTKEHGGHFNTDELVYGLTEYGQALREQDERQFGYALGHQWNVVAELYVKLEVVK